MAEYGDCCIVIIGTSPGSPNRCGKSLCSRPFTNRCVWKTQKLRFHLPLKPAKASACREHSAVQLNGTDPAAQPLTHKGVKVT